MEKNKAILSNSDLLKDIKKEPPESNTSDNLVINNSSTLRIKSEQPNSSNYVETNPEEDLKELKASVESDIYVKCENKCLKQEKTSVTTANLNNKPLKCSDEKPIQCQCNECILNQEYATKSSIKPIIRRFNCNICDYKCASRNCLKLHTKTHAGEKPFKCEVCQQKFSRISNLKAHKTIHGKRENFSCEFCDYTSKICRNVKRHMRRHTK